MRPLQGWLRCFPLAVVAIVPAPLTAQTFYAAVGLGPTITLNDQPAGSKSTHNGIAAIIGLEWPSRVGARLEVTAQPLGYVWLAADVTYRLALRSSPVQPYALAGAGWRLDMDLDRDNADPISTLGVGVRANLIGPVSAFGEGRVHHVVSGAPTYSIPPNPRVFQDRTFLFLTLGLSVTP